MPSGHNRSTDVIRQAMIHDFIQTVDHLPDHHLLDCTGENSHVWLSFCYRSSSLLIPLQEGMLQVRRGHAQYY